MAATFKIADLKNCHEIVELYNEVTLKLLRKGIHQWDYPWRVDCVKDAIQKREVYKAELDGSIVGAFWIGEANNFSGLLVEKGSLYLSKIAILPHFQGHGIGREIVSFARSFANNTGTAMYLDCWAGNDKLRQFYLECGLEYLGDLPEEDYLISVYKS